MSTSVKDSNGKSDEGRRRELWPGVAFLSMGLLSLLGAWREMTHHDGIILVVAPASMMPVLAAFLARRAPRK